MSEHNALRRKQDRAFINRQRSDPSVVNLSSAIDVLRGIEMQQLRALEQRGMPKTMRIILKTKEMHPSENYNCI